MKIALLTTKKHPICEKVIEYIGEDANILYSHNDVMDDYDFIISFLYPNVIPKSVLDKGKVNINFHPASSDYPGTGCYNFALYEEAREYGGVAHLMLPLVDSGKIISEKRFPINENNDSIIELQNETHKVLYELFVKIFNDIRIGITDWKEVSKWSKKPTTRKQLNAMCYIDNSMDKAEVLRRYKAFHHPKFPIVYRIDGLEINLGDINSQ